MPKIRFRSPFKVDQYQDYGDMRHYFRKAGLKRPYQWRWLAERLNISFVRMLEIRKGKKTTSLIIADRLSRALGGPISVWYAGPPIGTFRMRHWYDQLAPAQELDWIRIDHYVWRRLETGHRIEMSRVDTRFFTTIDGGKQWFPSVRAAAAAVDATLATKALLQRRQEYE